MLSVSTVWEVWGDKWLETSPGLLLNGPCPLGTSFVVGWLVHKWCLLSHTWSPTLYLSISLFLSHDFCAFMMSSSAHLCACLNWSRHNATCDIDEGWSVWSAHELYPIKWKKGDLYVVSFWLIVVSEFCHRKICCPVILMLICPESEILCQPLISTFQLSVCVRMIGCGNVLFDAQYVTQLSSKPWH